MQGSVESVGANVEQVDFSTFELRGWERVAQPYHAYFGELTLPFVYSYDVYIAGRESIQARRRTVGRKQLCVVQRTNNAGAELLKTRFPHYSFFVAILLQHTLRLRHSATVKVVSEGIDAARENNRPASIAATASAALAP
jgi:hypothetical protein